ncbi:MAG TPA: ECF-type sigma factor [Bryobacteraceae bacterium]|jgi:RNA polymerase sigma factor (TIGR02999 family)
MSEEIRSKAQWLQAWQAGDTASMEQVFPLVYDELRRLAARHLRSERSEHTLAPTALVHEAYLRLAAGDKHWEDQKHFFAVAAIVMRRILVDHAKERHRQKRGGNAAKLSLEEAVAISDTPDPRILLIDEALDKLARIDERKAKIIEMLFFGGLTFDEVSDTLGLSHSTLHREVRFAKSWISREISSGHGRVGETKNLET